MGGKLKDYSLHVRLPGDIEDPVSSVAGEMGTTPSGLARVLLERFIEARREHGDRIPWPPRFQYYEHDPVTQFNPYKIKPKNDLKAAED